MYLPESFFDLQVRFAKRVAELSGQTLADALLTHTTFYLRFGLPRSWDKQDPVWQEYLLGLEKGEDPTEWSHSFWLSRLDIKPANEPESPSFGCFSYNYEPDRRTIRFHFANTDTTGRGPLAVENLATRLAELRALFADAQQKYPQAEKVRGRSWMYNIEAYRRLFPPAYIRAAQRVAIDDLDLQFMALWGQFLDSDWQVKDRLAARFLLCIEGEGQQTPHGPHGLYNLYNCFPYWVLAMDVPVSVFRQFYGIRPNR